jgi:putative nucleotidyltransferase with HDIG domain
MTEADVKDAVLRIRDLPTLPSVLGKILATAADPDASALDLGQHIAADQSLSATLLKLVNSAYYGFYRQISSVTQAIVMLGFLEVRNLALTATAFRAFSRGKSSFDRLQLWRHSLATAMAAERLAKQANMAMDGCFESGLLHDIGKVALDVLYPEPFVNAAEQARQQGRFIHEVLKENFGMDHAEVGGMLAEHWNLPPAVVAAIRLHLHPERATEFQQLVNLTAVANAATYEAGLGETSNGCPFPYNAAAVAAAGLTQEQVAKVVEELRGSHEKIDEFLGVLKGK